MQCEIKIKSASLHGPSLHGYVVSQSAVYAYLLDEWRTDGYDATDESEAWKLDLRKMECDGTSNATLWANRPFTGKKWHLGNFPVV